jgi:hypothetical protein
LAEVPTNRLTLQQLIDLSHFALRFFAPQNHPHFTDVLGIRRDGNSITPLAVKDLMKYLREQAGWSEIDTSTFEVQRLLESLAVHQLLVDMGNVGSPVMGKHYYSFVGLGHQAHGDLWLGPVLGAEVIVHSVRQSVVHLLGLTADGDEHGGTALAVSERHMLTAKHVLEDMTLKPEQLLPSLDRSARRSVRVVDAAKHDRHDLAVLTIANDGPPLVPVRGLVTRDANWADPVFLMGFPLVPGSLHPVLTVQGGEVATPSVETYDGADLFLYSAIARPGNSGGPIFGADGHLLGLVTRELFQEPVSGRIPPPPFYAGLPASVIQEGLADLGFKGLIYAEQTRVEFENAAPASVLGLRRDAAI